MYRDPPPLVDLGTFLPVAAASDTKCSTALHLFATTGSALAILLQTVATCSEGFGLLARNCAPLHCHSAAFLAGTVSKTSTQSLQDTLGNLTYFCAASTQRSSAPMKVEVCLGKAGDCTAV